MPLTSKTFSEIITFTRASSAWGFDMDGVFKEFLTDEPRIERHPGSRKPLGLLVEGASTNSVQQSEAFTVSPWSVNPNLDITDNSKTDGFIPLSKFEKLAGGSNSINGNNISTTGATQFVISMFIAEGNVAQSFFLAFNRTTASVIKTVTVTISDGEFFGNGIYRHYLSVEEADGYTAGDEVDVFLYGPGTAEGAGAFVYLGGVQLELNRSKPTSYIPTEATTVTRAEDAATVDLSSLDLDGGITVFVRVLADDSDNAFGRALQIDNGTNNERVAVYRGGTAVGGIVSAGGAIIFSPVATVGEVDFGPFKIAIRVKGGDHASVVDDKVVQTQSDPDAPEGMNEMNIGRQDTGVNYLNGHVQEIVIYGRGLDNTELQELTT